MPGEWVCCTGVLFCSLEIFVPSVIFRRSFPAAHGEPTNFAQEHLPRQRKGIGQCTKFVIHEDHKGV